MIKDYIHPEDFLMDDTFRKYCEGTDEACIAFWEHWIGKNAERIALVQRAKQLQQVVSASMRPSHQQLETLKAAVQEHDARASRRWISNWAIAASLLVIVGAGLLYFFYSGNQQAAQTVYSKVYDAPKGSKKQMVLADGTKIALNSDSKIELAQGYGKSNRNVRLTGEAFFDVVHNRKLPFKVITKNFKVTVLGTVFNVKAYPQEKAAEASLLRGIIRIEDNLLKGNTITLKSGQKIVYYPVAKTNGHKNQPELAQLPKVEIGQLTTLNHTLVETAWTQNSLVFNNLQFAEIKPMLERWFNVNIEFKGAEIRQYRFTATFTKENILEVLKTLKKVKQFNYEMKGDQIIVEK